MSEQARLKISLAKKGKPSGWKGHSPSLETREKMRDSKIRLHQTRNPNYVYILDSSSRHGNKRIRRERMRQFGGSHTDIEWARLKAQYDWTCPSCKRREPNVKLTRDHVVAVSYGGSDNIENIQPLCNSCNARKGTSDIRY